MAAKTPAIISASRRTDIPAYYSKWFLNRLQEGFCQVRNPINRRISTVSLKPEDCLAIFLWTRNPTPLLRHLPGLQRRGYRFLANMTVVEYPPWLETHGFNPKSAADAFRRLSDIIGPASMIWRYDPIITGTGLSMEFHEQTFQWIAESLQGFTSRCIVSFLEPYRKIRHRLRQVTEGTPYQVHTHVPSEKLELVKGLSAVAGNSGMALSICCDEDFSRTDIPAASCIDQTLLTDTGITIPRILRKKPSRPGCGCYESVDIGCYDTCINGCVYCYANHSRTVALKHFQNHDPLSPLLSG